MKKFKVVDALCREQLVQAARAADVPDRIHRTGKRNVFGVTGPRGGSPKFYLDRGTGPLYPVSAGTAAMELSMGGFGE